MKHFLGVHKVLKAGEIGQELRVSRILFQGLAFRVLGLRLLKDRCG